MKTEEQVTTVEATAKRWKLGMLVGLAMSFGSCAGIAVAPTGSSASGGMALLWFTGLIMFVAAKIGAWWHHS
jgi:high-affinity Fe2+/Pb2+ permease